MNLLTKTENFAMHNLKRRIFIMQNKFIIS